MSWIETYSVSGHQYQREREWQQLPGGKWHKVILRYMGAVLVGKPTDAQGKVLVGKPTDAQGKVLVGKPTDAQGKVLVGKPIKLHWWRRILRHKRG